MKHTLRTSFVLILLLIAHITNAQNGVVVKTKVDSLTGATNTSIFRVEDPKRNMFIVNPLNFINLYNLSFYHSFNKSFAYGIGIGIPPSRKFIGFALHAESRIYFSQKYLSGFYIGM